MESCDEAVQTTGIHRLGLGMLVKNNKSVCFRLDLQLWLLKHLPIDLPPPTW